MFCVFELLSDIFLNLSSATFGDEEEYGLEEWRPQTRCRQWEQRDGTQESSSGARPLTPQRAGPEQAQNSMNVFLLPSYLLFARK